MTSRSNVVVVAEVALVVLMSTLIAFAACHRAGPPTHDELYHLMAAESWSEGGTFSIGDGHYGRAWMFTQTVGIAFNVFGESVEIARLVPLVGAAFWAAIVFWWARTYLGPAEGWLSAILLMLSPLFLEFAAFIRFYSWHAFLVFLAFTLVCSAIKPQIKLVTRAAWVMAIVGVLMVAWHLQRASMVAVVAIAAWLLMIGQGRVLDLGVMLRRRPSMLIAAIAVVAAALVLLVWGGVIESLWKQYVYNRAWNTYERFPIDLFHEYLKENYGLLWSCFPLIGMAAMVFRPKWGAACVIIFGVAFVLHSFAGTRAIRYIGYAIPFFLMATSVGIVLAFNLLRKFTISVDEVYFRGSLARLRLIRPAHLLISVVFSMFLVNDVWGVRAALRILDGSDGSFMISGFSTADWTEGSDELREIAGTVDVIVAEMPLAALYYIGKVDYSYNRSNMSETASGKQFAIDTRIGRPVISNAQSLESIIACHASGLVLIREHAWGEPVEGTDPETNELIERRTERLSIHGQPQLRAYRWITDHPDCGDLASKDKSV